MSFIFSELKRMLSLKFFQNQVVHLRKKHYLFRNDHFYSYLSVQQWEQTKVKCKKIRELFIHSKDVKESVEYLDTISNEICKVADMSYFLTYHYNSTEEANIAKAVYFNACTFIEELNSDPFIYAKLRSFKFDSEYGFDTLDTELQHVINKLLLDSEKSGVSYLRNDQSNILELTKRLNKIGNQFITASETPVKVSFKNCPTPLLNLCNGDRCFNLDIRHMNSRYDDVRESGWKIFYKFDKEREELLTSLLNNRNSLALETGFCNFTDRELKGSLAGSTLNVLNFLNELHYQLKPIVQSEIDYLNKIKRAEEQVNIWDIDYYSSECRSRFLQNYPIFQSNFSLSEVMNALNELSQKLFHIRISCDDTNHDLLWHKDAVKYSVHCCNNNALLGTIYFDLFSRTEKANRVCLHTLQCGTFQQMPVVSLICNFQNNGSLQFSDIELLFHEYGHALHAILGRTQYQHVSGTRCPTDFAEIPSILLDTLISRISVFQNLSLCKSKQSESEPNDLSVSDCFSATATQIQIYYGILDQMFHSSNIQQTQSIAKNVQSIYLDQFRIPCTTAWHQRFSHLYYYGGRYYSYLWAKAIVNMILEQYGLENKLKFVPEIRQLFEQGGSRCCNYQIETLLGEPLKIENMVQSLVKPLASFDASFISTLNKD